MLAAVSVTACACFRYSVFIAHKVIILNVGAHFARSQPNHTVWAHIRCDALVFSCMSATDLLLPQVLCLCLLFVKGLCSVWKEKEPVCVMTSPLRCRICFIEEKHTFQNRTDMPCHFQRPFIEGEGKRYLRVLLSAVGLCGMVQFQGWY